MGCIIRQNRKKWNAFNCRMGYGVHNPSRRIKIFCQRIVSTSRDLFPDLSRWSQLSGKISGTDDYLERFAAAEKKFSEQGYEVVNPAYEGTKLKDASYEDYMELSFQLLKDCDIIYMLKDWRTSPGANQEYGYALAKDMEIRFEK